MKKIIALLLLLCLCLPTFAACSDKDETESETGQTSDTEPAVSDTEPAEEEEEEVTLLKIIENDASEYVIVRSQNAKDYEKELAVRFRDTLKALTGVELAIKDDFEKEGTDFVRAKKEIIIGSTNREDEYTPAYSEINEGYHAFTAKHRLVLTAGSAGGLYEAIRQFFKLYYEVDISTETPTLAAYTDLEVDASYEEKHASASGLLPELDIPMSQYSIVCDTSDTVANRMGVNLRVALGKISGSTLTMKAQRADGGKQFVLAEDASVREGKFNVKVEGTDVVITAADYNGFGAANGYILAQYEKTYSLPFKDGFTYSGSYTNYLTDTAEASRYAYTKTGNARIMFYNVLWQDKTSSTLTWNDIPQAERSALQAELIGVYAPDVIGMQERSGATEETLVTALLADMGYAEAISPAVGNNYNTNFTPLLYNTETVTCLKAGYLWYKNQASDIGTLDKDSKSMTWGVFRTVDDGSTYIVASTHLCTQSDEIRAAQAAEAVTVLNALALEYGCPAFIGGDMNGNTESAAYMYFTATAGWADAYTVADKSTNIATHYNYPKYDTSLSMMQPTAEILEGYSTSIDRVLVSDKEAKINVFGVIADEMSRSASDHLPVFIDVTLSNGADWTLPY